MLTEQKLLSAHLKLPAFLRHTATLEVREAGSVSATHSVTNATTPDLTPKTVQLPEFAQFAMESGTFLANFYRRDLDIAESGLVPTPNDRVTINGRVGFILSVRVSLAGHEFSCLCQAGR